MISTYKVILRNIFTSPLDDIHSLPKTLIGNEDLYISPTSLSLTLRTSRFLKNQTIYRGSVSMFKKLSTSGSKFLQISLPAMTRSAGAFTPGILNSIEERYLFNLDLNAGHQQEALADGHCRAFDVVEKEHVASPFMVLKHRHHTLSHNLKEFVTVRNILTFRS